MTIMVNVTTNAKEKKYFKFMFSDTRYFMCSRIGVKIDSNS